MKATVKSVERKIRTHTYRAPAKEAEKVSLGTLAASSVVSFIDFLFAILKMCVRS